MDGYERGVGVMDQGPWPIEKQSPTPLWQQWQAPAIYVIDGQEFARLTVVGSVAGVTVTAIIRTLSQSGRLQKHVVSLASPSNRTTSTLIRAIGDGVVLNATIRVTAGTPIYGQVAAVLDLLQSNSGEQQATATLAAGYLTANQPLYAPMDQPLSFVDGPGAVFSITGTTPGPGAEINEVMPTGARREVMSFAFNLVTAVAVANRIVALTIDDGANIYFRDSPNFTQVASLTDNYSFAEGQNKAATPAANAIIGNLPDTNRLLAGHRIRTLTTALQAADQYSAPQYLVREWLEL